MVLIGFSTEEWRRVSGETEEEEEEDAEQILQSLTDHKINQQQCCWDVFIEEIPPRLPANRLQKLKIVCKNWERVIWSPDFVRLHLNRFNQNRIRVLVPWDSTMMFEYSIYDQQTKQICYPPEIGQRRSKILGSCDGLLCLHLEGLCHSRSIAMYNPSTGKYFCVESSPEDNYDTSCSWFGHRPCSGEYVLVLGSFYDDDEIGVYKLNSNSSLKKIHSTRGCTSRNAFYGGHERGVGTLLHGALHWPLDKYRFVHPVDDRHAISAYHLENNKYFEISVPKLHDLKLGVVDGCLFAFSYSASAFAGLNSRLEIWIMKEYGIRQSWIKYAQFEGFATRDLSPLGIFPNAYLNLRPNGLGLTKCTFNDNRALLLHDYSNYNLRNNNHHNYYDYRNYCEAIVCADSLVSPKIVGT